MINRLFRWGGLLAVSGAMALGVGCASRPKVATAVSPVSLPGAFSASGEAATPSSWWTTFADSELDALQAAALADNPSLRATWERLRQADASLATAAANRRPSVTASGDYTGTRNHTDGQTLDSARAGLGLVASYELDLWGRLASESNAASSSRAAAALDVHAAAISLSAEVADAWFTIRSLRSRMATQQTLLQTNESQQSLMDLRFRKGQAALSDLTQQQELVTSSGSDMLSLQRQLESAEIRLALLLGQSPTDFQAPAGDTLPSLPALPAVDTPASVLLQRPDVRAALLRVEAADWQVAAAVTDRLPTLKLSVNLSSTAMVPGALLQDWLANLAGDLALPILDGGRRKAEVSRTQAAAAEAYWAFASTLLSAWGEVETALRNEATQTALVAQFEQQLTLADRANDQLRSRYAKGAATYTSYLTQLKSSQQQRLALAQQRLVLLQDRIALHRAIAGAWELSAPDTTPGRVEHFLIDRAADRADQSTDVNELR